MDKIPLIKPDPVGLKRIEMLQEAPADRVPPQSPLLAETLLKSPVTLMLLITKSAVPVLESTSLLT
jgi:hypothetical protein